MTYASALHSANGAEFWYADGRGFGSQGVWRAALAGSAVTGDTRLATVAGVAGLTRAGSRLWLVTTAGALISLDPLAAGQTPVVASTLAPAASGCPRA